MRADDINVAPTAAGMPGAGTWEQLLGWIAQGGLFLCFAAIVIGGGGWFFGSRRNSSGAEWGKSAVFGGAIGAVVIGLAGPIVNLLFAVGQKG